MKRTVITTMTVLAFLAMFSAEDTFHPYEFTRHAIANTAFPSQRKVDGSLIGGIKETQEMLDYSVAHDIYPEVEIIKADASEIDKAWRNVAEGKVKFRYVIDMSTIK